MAHSISSSRNGQPSELEKKASFRNLAGQNSIIGASRVATVPEHVRRPQNSLATSASVLLPHSPKVSARRDVEHAVGCYGRAVGWRAEKYLVQQPQFAPRSECKEVLLCIRCGERTAAAEQDTSRLASLQHARSSQRRALRRVSRIPLGCAEGALRHSWPANSEDGVHAQGQLRHGKPR